MRSSSRVVGRFAMLAAFGLVAGCGSNDAPVGPDSELRGQWHVLAVGLAHSCAIDRNGVAYCWGLNTYGQNGPLSVGFALIKPTRVSATLRFKRIAAGGS